MSVSGGQSCHSSDALIIHIMMQRSTEYGQEKTFPDDMRTATVQRTFILSNEKHTPPAE